MKQEVTPLTYKIEEYRNGVKLGEVMREVIFIAQGCSNPNIAETPILNAVDSTHNSTITACTGAELEVAVLGTISSSDSLTFSDSTNIPGGTFSRIGDTAFFHWTPTVADTQTEPYFLTIYARTTNCNYIGKNSKTFSIYVNPRDLPATTAITSLGCGDYHFQAANYPQNHTITWAVEGEFLANPQDSSFFHSFTQGGMYPVSLTVNGQCPTTYYDTIQVDSVFQVHLPEADTTCHGSAIALTSQFISGPADSFRWSTGSTSDTLFHTVTKDTLFGITAYQNGCSWSDTVEVIDILQPVVQLNQSPVICPSDSAKLYANVSQPGRNNSPITYSWNGPNGPIIKQSSSIWVKEPGTYTITATNAFGCWASDSTVVTDFSPAQYSIMPLSCGSYQLQVDSLQAGAAFLWTVDGDTLGTSTDTSFIHTFTQSGSYPVTLTVTDSCSITYRDTIVVGPLFKVNLPEYDTACHGSTVPLMAQVLNGPADSFAWSTSDTGSRIQHLMNGDAIVSVTAYRNGCSWSDSINLTEVRLPEVNLGADEILCPQNSIQISGTVTLPDSGYGPATLAWNGPGGSLPGQQQQVWVNQTGSYTLAATNTFGCVGIDTLAVIPFSHVDAGADTAVCAGSPSFSLHGIPQGGTWSGPGVTANLLNPGLLNVGTYQFVYSYFDSLGTCVDWDTMEVEIKPLPTLAGSANDTICMGDTVSLSASGAASYTWWPSYRISADTGSTILAAPHHTTTYTVIGTDNSGCIDSSHVNLHVLNDCVWPGDVNYDGVVNNLDLLPIGLFFGETGPQRPNASLLWTAQVAPDWDTATANYNLKHVDTDGDSTITALDTAAISLNYSLTHPRGAGSRSPVPLWLQGPDAIHPGDTAVFEVYAGDSTWKMQEAYGLAFSISYPNSAVQASLQFTSGLADLSELIYLQKHFAGLGLIEAAVSRTDHTPKSGIVKIGELTVITPGTAPLGQTLALEVQDISAMNARGQVQSLQATTTNIEVTSRTGFHHQPLRWQVELYPNPADHELFITADIDLERVTVLDIVGKQVPVKVTVNANRAKVNTTTLQQGLYLVQIETEQGTLIRKVLVE